MEKKCGFGQFSGESMDDFTDTRNLPMKEETTKVVGYQGYYVMGILRCLRAPGVMRGDVLLL